MVGRCRRRGALLAIDYGYEGPALGETLQAVERLDASLDEDDAGDGIVATGAAAPEAVDTPPEA